mgnify:CR=1 FL=1
MSFVYTGMLKFGGVSRLIGTERLLNKNGAVSVILRIRSYQLSGWAILLRGLLTTLQKLLN